MTGKLDALCRMTDVTRNARIPAATKQSQKKVLHICSKCSSATVECTSVVGMMMKQ